MLRARIRERLGGPGDGVSGAPPRAGSAAPSAEPRFTRLSAADVTVWVAPAFAGAVRELGLLAPDAVARALRTSRDASRGRTATAVLSLPGHEERLHLRPLRHGGMLARLWGTRVLGPGRALAELRAAAALRARGAPVPQPVLAWSRRAGGPGVLALAEVAVGSVYVEGSRDGLRFLASRPDAARLRRAAQGAGRAVRRFHDAGGRHADLHVQNLLWCEQAGEAWVVDLDRGRAGDAPGPARRMRELMRLLRSLRKRGLLDAVGARGCAAFFGAYAGGDRALRAALLRHLGRERLRVAVHALGYRRA